MAPGYPLFLAIFKHHLLWALVAQSVLGVGVCFVVGLFLTARSGLYVGLLGAALLAVDLPSATYDAIWENESLFRDVLFVGVLMALLSLARQRFDGAARLLGLGAAVLLGAAAFVRPIGLALAPLAALPFILRAGESIGSRLLWSAMAISLTCLVMIGWTVRNYRQRGIWAFSTISGYNMYYYDAAYIRSVNTGQDLLASQKALAQELGFNDPWETPDSYYRLMWKRGLQTVLASPFATSKMVGRSLVWLAIDPIASPLAAMLGMRVTGETHTGRQFSGALDRGAHFARHPMMGALLIFQFLCVAFEWVGVGRCLSRLRSDRSRDMLTIVPAALVVLFLFLLSALGAGPAAVVRFRVPAMPYIAMLAALGWVPSETRSSKLPGVPIFRSA
jgi:hypothetical protein